MNDGIESESERMEPVMIYCKLKSTLAVDRAIRALSCILGVDVRCYTLPSFYPLFYCEYVDCTLFLIR